MRNAKLQEFCTAVSEARVIVADLSRQAQFGYRTTIQASLQAIDDSRRLLLRVDAALTARPADEPCTVAPFPVLFRLFTSEREAREFRDALGRETTLPDGKNALAT